MNYLRHFRNMEIRERLKELGIKLNIYIMIMLIVFSSEVRARRLKKVNSYTPETFPLIVYVSQFWSKFWRCFL